MADFPGSAITIVSGTDTHGDVLGELQAVALIPPVIPPPVASRWLGYTQVGGTVIHTEGQIQLCWYPIPFGVVIGGIAAEVTTAGSVGALWRYMLYKHNVSTGLPDALLSDLGTISVETTGVKSISTTGSPAPDNYGGVWAAYVNQGAAGTRATVRITSAQAPAVTYSTASNMSTNVSGWQTTATTHTGAAPANIGALGASGNVPRFLVQYG